MFKKNNFLNNEYFILIQKSNLWWSVFSCLAIFFSILNEPLFSIFRKSFILLMLITSFLIFTFWKNTVQELFSVFFCYLYIISWWIFGNFYLIEKKMWRIINKSFFNFSEDLKILQDFYTGWYFNFIMNYIIHKVSVFLQLAEVTKSLYFSKLPKITSNHLKWPKDNIFRHFSKTLW